jgi:hypothetical protein
MRCISISTGPKTGLTPSANDHHRRTMVLQGLCPYRLLLLVFLVFANSHADHGSQGAGGTAWSGYCRHGVLALAIWQN